MTFPTWPNANVLIVTDDDYAQAEAFAGRLAEAVTEKRPEVPPECWNASPVDPDRCRDATRAMCSGQ